MDDSLNNNFYLACNKQSERISIIFTSSSVGRQRYRNTSAANRGGCFNNRVNEDCGKGRGDRGSRGYGHIDN